MDYPTLCSLTDQEINFNQLLESITLPNTGAAVTFTGMVREETQRLDRRTDYLVYEAYETMAMDKLKQVAGEIRKKWPSVVGISIVHRIGKLYPGVPTVVIACTAAHRDTGVFDAAHYGIDRLKEIVPIWKKEVGPNGEEWIEGEYHPEAGE